MIKIQETSKFHQIVIITSLKGDESFTMEFLRIYQYFTSDFMDFAGASKGEELRRTTRRQNRNPVKQGPKTMRYYLYAL